MGISDRSYGYSGISDALPTASLFSAGSFADSLQTSAGCYYGTTKKDLDVANERARNVLAGFCGWYGACGAAVGVGIFMSIFTNTNPCSEKTWSLTNRATAQSLLKMSEINGPRCCKRNTYIAIDSTRDFIEKYLSISLDKPEKVVCKYSERNLECKKEQCPFYLSD